MKERERYPDDQLFPNGGYGMKPVISDASRLPEDAASGFIELTDIVEHIGLELSPSRNPSSADDDPLIDLIEPIEPRPAVAPEIDSVAQDDIIMDLFQIVDDMPLNSSQTLLQGADADLIDLIDLIDLADLAAPAEPAFLNEPLEENNDIIRLDDILKSERNAAIPLFDFSDPIPLTASPVLSSIDEGPYSHGHLLDETPLVLTPTRIEQAIERMVQSKYGQTIEQMIAEIVEKVVLREMQTLKRSLMEGEDDLMG